MSDNPNQRDLMRSLFREFGDDEDAVCVAYANAERDGKIVRKSNEHGMPPEAYAKALWKDGKAKGWLS